MKVTKWLVTSTLIASSVCWSAQARAGTFTEVLVFGDSLSDLDRAFVGSGGVFPPYGGSTNGRYSNGPVWVEYLGDRLGIPTNPDTNYAVGAASSGDINYINSVLPTLLDGLTQQVNNNMIYDANALYIVAAGSNDYIAGGAMDPSNTINNLNNNLTTLLDNGAKNLLVANLPNLGALPQFNETEFSIPLNLLTQQHNALLASTINTLQSSYSDADIRLLDFNQEFNTILSNPSLFGFTNVTEGCFSVSCSNPNEYFFWDESHPTTRGHSLMSDLAARTLGVPEPSSVFGLLMVGIGGLFLKKRT